MELPRSARLGVEQQADPAHALLLEKIEYVHDVFVAHAAIGGDHDRLIRALRLPLPEPRDQPAIDVPRDPEVIVSPAGGTSASRPCGTYPASRVAATARI